MNTLQNKQFIEAVLERDIDLLILEELHVSEVFRRWLVGQMQIAPDYAGFTGVWHSLTAAILGESDVVMVYVAADNTRQAIMIENKISEKAQTNQALRYRERGQEGITHGWWDRYTTCIIAPQRYLSGMATSETYDVYLPYESIEGYFLSEGSERSKYRATMLREAIEQNRRGYQPVVSNLNTDFWQEYYLYCREHFPELNMNQPEGKGKKSRWVYFHPAGKEKKMRLQHKMNRGCVDLEFTNQASKIEEIKQKYLEKMDANMCCELAKKSAVIRIKVGIVDNFRPFSEQQAQVHVALEAVKRLANLL